MFTNIPTNILGFVIVLGFLIFAHESGHFFVAKFFKVRVLVFSFGFGKRLFGFRRGDTDYRISAIPLGGYVRMAGDNPEEAAAAPDEFLSKPKWQRLLILFAGPGMNLILAIGFIAIINMVGYETPILRPIIGDVVAGKPAARAGLQPGDLITRVNGDPIDGWSDFHIAIQMNYERPMRLTYVRNNQPGTTTVTPDRIETEHGPMGQIGVTQYISPVIEKLEPGSQAVKSGLHVGDRIAEVGGKPVRQMTELYQALDTEPPHPLSVVAIRNGTQRIQLNVMTGTEAAENFGVGIRTEYRRLGPIAAISDSVKNNTRTLKYMLVSLGRLFGEKSAMKQMAGPATIAKLSGQVLRSSWRDLFAFMALISLNLGVLNLFPIPVLDGGHIAILLVESAARRDLPLRAKERALQLGFALLALFMIIVIYFDVMTNIRGVMKG